MVDNVCFFNKQLVGVVMNLAMTGMSACPHKDTNVCVFLVVKCFALTSTHTKVTGQTCPVTSFLLGVLMLHKCSLPTFSS